MKNLQTFEEFLNESQLNEGLNDTQFSESTAERIWKFILDAANASKLAKENKTLEFSSEGQSGKIMDPQSSFWSEILSNSGKFGIGQISATTSELLIMITEGRTVKGYLTLTYDTLKQDFSKKLVPYIEVIPKIQDFSRQRQFKKIVYSA